MWLCQCFCKVCDFVTSDIVISSGVSENVFLVLVDFSTDTYTTFRESPDISSAAFKPARPAVMHQLLVSIYLSATCSNEWVQQHTSLNGMSATMQFSFPYLELDQSQ